MNSESRELTKDDSGVYQIGSAEELAEFAELVNNGERDADAVLTADIVLNKKIEVDENGTMTNADKLSSWNPIGTNSSNAYTGTFNGNGHKIENLYINNTDSTAKYQCLFGYVWTGGTVQNLTVTGSVSSSGDYVGGTVGYNDGGTVTDCTFSGSVSGGKYVGGVVGYNLNGSITDCAFSGSVSGSKYVGGVVGQNFRASVENCYNTGAVNGSGDQQVGGVVGRNSENGSVENCYNAGIVTCSGSSVGGVVGQNNVSSTVKNCYNTGDVSGNGNNVGGVVGYNGASVKNCYNTGNVNSNVNSNQVGGVVGYNIGASTTNCYNTGSVASSGSHVGGVVGYNQSSTVTGCYFLQTDIVNDGLKGIGDGSGEATAKNDTAFHSGEVAHLLQSTQASQVWGQNIVKDKSPILTSDPEKTVYKVPVNLNHTGAQADQVIYTNSTLNAKEPIREGYTFGGWYADKDCTDSPVTEITATTSMLYAKWTATEYKVTLHTNDGTIADGQNVTSYTYGIGATLPTKDEITKTGYTFVGWYDNKDFTGDPVTAIGKDAIGDKEYWAKWEEAEAPEPEEPPYTGKYSYEISTSVGDNGTLTVDRYATEGEKVTITVSPDEAYLLDDLVVTANGKEVEVTDNGDGTYTFTMPSADVRISATFAEDPDWTEPEEPSTDVSDIFLDVAPNAWYKDAVQYAYDNGLMTGVSDTEFAPEATTTHAMIVSILARLEGVTSAEAAGFADVEDEWYATAVNWAASVGVVNGYEDNTFQPNTAITREQLAAILMNYAAYKGEDVSARADLSAYIDQPSTWAEEAMQWAVAEELITGVTNDELQPQSSATRAQVAAILQRFLCK